MTTKRLNNYKVDKICGVCGDNAIGRNFGAITCESCKAFFRRAAVKNKIMNCSFENKCQINPKNRKSCKKCRLVKCYAIGMKKELIVKRESEKRPKRQRNDTVLSNDSSESLGSLATDESAYETEFSPQLSIQSPSDSSEETDPLFFGKDFDALMENCCLDDDEMDSEIVEFDKYLSDTENSLDFIETQNNSSLSAVVRPIATFDKDFNYIELNRLLELKTAAEEINNFTGDYKYSIQLENIKEMFEKMASLNVFDQTIESVIKFCKSVGPFKDVCENDQIALIKNSFGDILNLKLLTYFDFDEEYFEYVLANKYSVRCYLNIFKLEEEKSYNIVKAFYNSLPKDWKYDTTLLNLMMAIALFNSETPKLMHNQMVKLNQQMYLYLLQRYLIQKFQSEDKSSENMSRALRKLMELHNMYETCKEVSKKYIEFLTPLAREVYDI